MTITFVKKILADGSPCAKCADVIERFERSGSMGRIDATLVADERDAASAGMLLAAELAVDRAPFFVVERDGQRVVYTSWLTFQREVLEAKVEAADEDNDILASNPDLDFL